MNTTNNSMRTSMTTAITGKNTSNVTTNASNHNATNIASSGKLPFQQQQQQRQFAFVNTSSMASDIGPEGSAVIRTLRSYDVIMGRNKNMYAGMYCLWLGVLLFPCRSLSNLFPTALSHISLCYAFVQATFTFANKFFSTA